MPSSDTQFKKGQPRTTGRKKGTPNKISASMKQAFKDAFEGLGGVPALIAWARRSNANRTEFYRLSSKLLPLEITGRGGGPIEFTRAERDQLRDKIMGTEQPQPPATSPRLTH